MKLSCLFEDAKIKYPAHLADIEITNIVTDSRRAVVGSLFICITGIHTDGHEHIGEAIRAGARVIVAEHVYDGGEGGAATVFVENTRRCAALLYNAWHGEPAKDMTLVAVTGTNGKTSVTQIASRILESVGARTGIIGTLGALSCGKCITQDSSDDFANMTTPDPEELYAILSKMRDDGVKYVFIEASSHALDLCRLDALRPDIAVLTNFTREHLDFHKNLENYFLAKAKLFTMCREAIINIDDAKAFDFCRAARCERIYTVSAKGKADFYADNVSFEDGAWSYELVSYNSRVPIKLGTQADFFVINSLEAAAIACLLGVDDGDIARALSDIRSIDGRMERVDLGEDADITVYIDYAHTPDALENILLGVRRTNTERHKITLLFGCGGERDRGKRSEMAKIASKLSDSVIITSDNCRTESIEQIISDILKGIDKEKEYKVILQRERAIEYAIENARAGEIIILAGKGHERYELGPCGKHFFDERIIAKEAYKTYRSR